MNLKNKLILFVDDDEDDRDFFSFAFQSKNNEYDLVMLNDGVFLLNYLEQNEPTPRLLFLDINMPRLSGLDCLKKIRSSTNYMDLPIAMYSTSTNDTDLQDALELGANIFIKKPVKIDQLKEIISEVLKIEWTSEKVRRRSLLMLGTGKLG